MLGGVDRATVLDWSRRIEADGYDSIGFGERIAYRNLELTSVLAAAAAVTERVEIMSTVVVLPMHSEVWVAKQSATLDVLSGGRYTLGVGVGGRDEDFRALGRDPSKRHARLDAQVDRLRDLWGGVPPDEGLDPIGPPPSRRIPMMSGALGPKSIARSARWADGIAGFELDPTPAGLTATAASISAAWNEAGRDEPPTLMTSWWFALGDDAGPRLHQYAANYLGVFGSELADAMALACTVAGPDALRRALDAAEAAGFAEVQLVPTTADLAELDRVSELLDR
jgi:alkanesulfonate monooxygenase SsuD/methylene tetrahydromethanopterin reductase-like flavin-dependent oxidoreductase (luciferase family)